MPVERLTPKDAKRSLKWVAGKALTGDEQAFEELYGRLGGGVRGFLSQRIGADDELVEELAQRTWVEVWKALQKKNYKPERAEFSTYLYGVAYKVLLKHRRLAAGGSIAKVIRIDARDAVAEAALRTDDDHADVLDFCALLDALRACLTARRRSTALADEERRVLSALARGLKERAVADEIGIAASTVNARKQAALGKLRRCLTEKGFTTES